MYSNKVFFSHETLKTTHIACEPMDATSRWEVRIVDKSRIKSAQVIPVVVLYYSVEFYIIIKRPIVAPNSPTCIRLFTPA